jgi:hypothetical protein
MDVCHSKAERVKYAESLQNLRAMVSRDGNLYCLGGLGTVNMETTFETSKSTSNTRNRGMVDRASKIAQTKSEELQGKNMIEIEKTKRSPALRGRYLTNHMRARRGPEQCAPGTQWHRGLGPGSLDLHTNIGRRSTDRSDTDSRCMGVA